MKKIIYVPVFFLIAAAIVIFAGSCDPETQAQFEDWLGNGDEFTPIVPPEIRWFGTTAEVGEADIDIWNINVVTTTRKENGALRYDLEDNSINTFSVLEIKSMENAPKGRGDKPLSHENKSENEPGVLFMWDHNHDDKDEDGAADNYYRGVLKVHQNVFQKYHSFVLRVRYVGDDYLYFLIKPQRRQLKNRAGDSYIFLIREATGDFNESTTDYIMNVFFEEIETETPDDPPTPPPEPPPPPPPPYTVTYEAIEEGEIVSADGIFTADGSGELITAFEYGDTANISFTVTTPENYRLDNVKAGDQTITATGGVFSYTADGDVTITANFTYEPPPDPEIYDITYKAVDLDGDKLAGVFSGIDANSQPPDQVEENTRAAFKVTAPSGEISYFYQLVEVKAGETALTEKNGHYSFKPSGAVTVTATFEKGFPPVDDFEVYDPNEDDDPYGTATFVTPPDEIDTGNNTRKVVIISTASEGGAEVDADNKWLFDKKPLKKFYEDAIKAKTKTEYNDMIKIKNSEGKRATWIWDRSDSWVYGISGCFTVITASRFDIGRNEKVTDSNVWFYFACDNACVIYVNGELAGYTTKAFEKASKWPSNKPGETSEWRFTGLDNSDFTGDNSVWDTLYKIDIKDKIREGHNEILIMAANNDSSGGRWNDTNNPAALLFASQFTVGPN